MSVAASALGETSKDDYFASKTGFLFKEGAVWKNWKRRWFRMAGFTLVYWETKDEKEPPKGAVFLDGCLVRDADVKTGRPFSFEIFGPKRTFLASADDEKSKAEWMALIDYNIKFAARQKARVAAADKAVADLKLELTTAATKIGVLEKTAADAAAQAVTDKTAAENVKRQLTEDVTRLTKEVDSLKAEIKKSEGDKLTHEKQIIALKANIDELTIKLNTPAPAPAPAPVVVVRSPSPTHTVVSGGGGGDAPRSSVFKVIRSAGSTSTASGGGVAEDELDRLRKVDMEAIQLRAEVTQARADKRVLRTELRRLNALLTSAGIATGLAAAAPAPAITTASTAAVSTSPVHATTNGVGFGSSAAPASIPENSSTAAAAATAANLNSSAAANSAASAYGAVAISNSSSSSSLASLTSLTSFGSAASAYAATTSAPPSTGTPAASTNSTPAPAAGAATSKASPMSFASLFANADRPDRVVQSGGGPQG